MKSPKRKHNQKLFEKARQQFITELIQKLGAPNDPEKVADILGMKKERQNEHP